MEGIVKTNRRIGAIMDAASKRLRDMKIGFIGGAIAGAMVEALAGQGMDIVSK